jgi:hypothetical protein
MIFLSDRINGTCHIWNITTYRWWCVAKHHGRILSRIASAWVGIFKWLSSDDNDFGRDYRNTRRFALMRLSSHFVIRPMRAAATC